MQEDGYSVVRSRSSAMLCVAATCVILLVFYLSYSPRPQYSNILDSKGTVSERSRVDYEQKIDACTKEKQTIRGDLRKLQDELASTKGTLEVYKRATDTYLRGYWDLVDWLKNQSVDLSDKLPPRPPPMDLIVNYTLVMPRPELIVQVVSTVSTLSLSHAAQAEKEKKKCATEKARLTQEIDLVRQQAEDARNSVKNLREENTRLKAQLEGSARAPTPEAPLPTQPPAIRSTIADPAPAGTDEA